MFKSILVGAATVPLIWLVMNLFLHPTNYHFRNFLMTIGGFAIVWIFVLVFWLVIGFTVWGICEEFAPLRCLVSSAVRFSFLAFAVSLMLGYGYLGEWESSLEIYAVPAAISAFITWWLEKWFWHRSSKTNELVTTINK